MRFKFSPKVLNHLLSSGLILLSIFLSYKFIIWNWYKVEENISFVKGIIEAPTLPQIEILQNGTTVYRKLFKYRSDRIYLANDLPESLFLGGGFKLSVSRQLIDKGKILKKQMFIVVKHEGNTFTLVSSGCSNRDFIKIFKKLRKTSSGDK